MKPRTELRLRQGARAICIAGAGIILAGMLIETLMVLLDSPGFVMFLKVVLAISLGLAVVHGFLWAVSRDNRDRIEELKRICRESSPR